MRRKGRHDFRYKKNREQTMLLPVLFFVRLLERHQFLEFKSHADFCRLVGKDYSSYKLPVPVVFHAPGALVWRVVPLPSSPRLFLPIPLEGGDREAPVSVG